MSQKTVKIFKINLNSSPTERLLNNLNTRLEKSQKTVIVTPNPEIILQTRNNPRLLRALQQSDIALADGVGLVWATRFLSGKEAPRITGRQFTNELLKLADRLKLKVYLLGASKEVNAEALVKIKADYKNLIAEGRCGPKLDHNAKPVTLRDRKSYYEILKHINTFKPDILFVAFGAPKQELWIQDNLKKLDARIIMTVGGTLDYIAGKMNIPPGFISKLGLEWFWRLWQNPSRIFRIFKAVFVFPIYIFSLKLKKR